MKSSIYSHWSNIRTYKKLFSEKSTSLPWCWSVQFPLSPISGNHYCECLCILWGFLRASMILDFDPCFLLILICLVYFSHPFISNFQNHFTLDVNRVFLPLIQLKNPFFKIMKLSTFKFVVILQFGFVFLILFSAIYCLYIFWSFHWTCNLFLCFYLVGCVICLFWKYLYTYRFI